MRKILPLVLGLSLLSACGGDDEARSILQQTFADSAPLRSGKVDLRLEVDGLGLPQLTRGMAVGLKGPFESQGKGKVPKFDLDLSLGSGDAVLRAGAISTGDRGWIKLQGATYTMSKATFDELLASSRGSGDGALRLSTFGISPSSWLDSAETVGRERLSGEAVDHVRGEVDVPRLLKDLGTLLERAGSLGGTASAATPADLTDDQKRQLVETIKAATVDVWSGAEDRRLRRLLVRIRLDPKGAQQGSMELDLRFSDLDAPQAIEAPRDARPFSELQEGLAALGQALQAQQGQAGPGPDAGAQAPSAPTPGTGAYAECLARAGDDLRAQQDCASLLGA